MINIKSFAKPKENSIGNINISNIRTGSTTIGSDIDKYFYMDDVGNLHTPYVFIGDKQVAALGIGNTTGGGSGTGTGTNINIIDNLYSDSTNSALSANLGRILKELIDNIGSGSGTGGGSIFENESILAAITQTNIDNWNTAATNNHIHSNKSILDKLTQSVIDNSHTHSNKTILDDITSEKITNWNTAYTNNHTHSNKSILDKLTQSVIDNSHTHSNKTTLDNITDSKITEWNKINDYFYLDSDGNLHTGYNLIGDKQVSAYGLGSTSGATGGNLSVIDNLNSTSTTSALSANLGRILKSLIDNIDGGGSVFENSTVLAGITGENISNWNTAFTNNHTHSNKSVLDGITSAKISNWDAAYSWGNHASAGYLTSHLDISGKENTSNKVTSWSTTPNNTHYPSEKLVKDSLDGKISTTHAANNVTTTKITNWDNAATNSHTHSNKSVLDNLTQTVIDNSHSHSNKTVLDGITSTKVSNWDKINDYFYLDSDGNLHTGYNLIGDKQVSAYGLGSSGTSGGNLSVIDNLTSTSTTSALSANQGRILKSLIDNIEATGSVFENSTVLAGITSDNITHWNTAYTNNHTHSNKSVIDSITSAKVSNWDSAYGWGNHASAGYVKSSGVTSITIKNGTGITGGSNTATTTTGTYTIGLTTAIQTDIANGATAYGWGNHASAGYLTSHQDISGKENTSNKVTSWSTTTNNTHYPSEKLVKDSLDGKISTTHAANNVTTTKISNWDTAYTNNHTHSNKSVLDGITSTKVSNWDTAATNLGNYFYIGTDGNLHTSYNFIGDKSVSAYGAGSSSSGGNLSVVDNLTSTSTSSALSANQGRILKGLIDTLSAQGSVFDNATVLAGITSTKVSNWDSAATNSHTHSNKTVIDGITSTKVSNWDTAYGWGNHASAGYLKSHQSLANYATIAKVYDDSGDYRQYLGKDGTNNTWVRTTSSGIIPYTSGGAGKGHCGLGTSTWYFSYAYIDNIYGYLNGNISGSSTSCSGNSATSTRSSYTGRDTFIQSPKGGVFSTSTSSYTGYLRIKLPCGGVNTMMSFYVDIYDYAENQIASYLIGGYNYSGGWYNVSAQCVSSYSGNYANLTVRFGVLGDKSAISIGEANTTWSYPQVVVRDVLLGYGAGTIANYFDSWTIDFSATAITEKYHSTSTKKENTGIQARYAASAGSVAWSNVSGKPSSYTPSSHTHTKSQITDFPTSMPASDVYSWAKAATKPSYSAKEVGALPKQSSVADMKKWSTDDEWGFSEWTTNTTNRPTDYGTSLNFRDSTTWYYRLAFATSGRIYHYSGINTTALTLKGTIAYTSDIPTTLPASDVYSWAKASTKPSYSWSEITGTTPTWNQNTTGTAAGITGYSFKTLSAVGTSGWSNVTTDSKIIPTMSFIAYWNGAYSGTSSNLTYCANGTIIGSSNIGSQSVNYATSAGSSTSSGRAQYLETQNKDNTNFYGNSYKLYGKWDTNTHVKLKVTDGTYTVGVDDAVSVVDYGNTASRIKIGYSGAGLSSCTYLAAYGTVDGGTVIKDINTANVKVGSATSADAIKALDANDNASATDDWRKVWISYANGTTGRPALSDKLAFQTSTNSLKIGSGIIKYDSTNDVFKINKTIISEGSLIAYGASTTVASDNITLKATSGVTIDTTASQGGTITLGHSTMGMTTQLLGYSVNIGTDSNRPYGTSIYASYSLNINGSNTVTVKGTNTTIEGGGAGLKLNGTGSAGITISSAGALNSNKAITVTSDTRLKNIGEDVHIEFNDVLEMPVFNYSLKDDESNTQMIGSSAQYWQDRLQNAVNENAEGYLGLDYTAVNLASNKALAEKVKEQDDIIKEQEETIKSLEERLTRLEQLLLNK